MSRNIMKILMIFSMLCFTLVLNAKKLTVEEAQDVKKEIHGMLTNFNNGNTDDILQKTHPSLIKMIGGQEKFKELMLGVVKMIKKAEIKFEKVELGEPTQIYSAGGEEVVFIPSKSIMTVGDKRLKSTSFMVAIRTVDTKEWKFLDGAGHNENKELLWMLLPKLTRELVLPELKTELIPKEVK